MFALVLFIIAKTKSVLRAICADLEHVAVSPWMPIEFPSCFLGGLLGYEEFFMQFC